MTADCGCQMIQDGVVGETPIYGVRFCNTHDPKKVREHCAKLAEGVDWGAHPIADVSAEEWYEDNAGAYIAELIRKDAGLQAMDEHTTELKPTPGRSYDMDSPDGPERCPACVVYAVVRVKVTSTIPGEADETLIGRKCMWCDWKSRA